MIKWGLIALYGAIGMAIILETLVYWYLVGIPGSSGYILWVPGSLGLVMSAAFLGLIILVGLLIAAPEWLVTYVRGRLLTGRVQGVVLSTNTLQLTLQSGKDGYLAETGYVYEIAGVRHTGAYRPGVTASRLRWRLNRAKTQYPPGRVVEVYYDPENPGRSSLNRGMGQVAAIGLALALFIATWLVSAGLSFLFGKLVLIVVLSLGATMWFGVRKQIRHQQDGY